MDVELERIFGKTDEGRKAIATRSPALTVKARTVLILINGQDNVRTLRGKLGPGSAATIDELLGAGFIELLAPSPSQPPEPTVAPPASVAPDPIAPEVREKLHALRREAVARLAPHFGPDVLIVAKRLLAATSLGAFAEALAGIERQLAVYVGKKEAARILVGLRA